MVCYFCFYFSFLFSLLEMNYYNISLEKQSCFTLQFIGVYMFTLILTSIILNMLNIWLYYRIKLITPVNCFMITLIWFNLIASFFETPMVYNGYFCKTISLVDDKLECIIIGFAMYFVGNLETYLLVAISVERYVKVFKLKHFYFKNLIKI
jgi:hypothetical protein